jgi:hypothetical protein
MWPDFRNASASQGQYHGDDFAAYTSGDNMNWNLSDADRRAVDLLMNRHTGGIPDGDGNGASTDGGSTAPFSALQATAESRLHRVEQWLRVLDNMPADDPPGDLVSRTLRRLDEVIQTRSAAPPQVATNSIRPTA